MLKSSYPAFSSWESLAKELERRPLIFTQVTSSRQHYQGGFQAVSGPHLWLSPRRCRSHYFGLYLGCFRQRVAMQWRKAEGGMVWAHVCIYIYIYMQECLLGHPEVHYSTGNNWLGVKERCYFLWSTKFSKKMLSVNQP